MSAAVWWLFRNLDELATSHDQTIPRARLNSKLLCPRPPASTIPNLGASGAIAAVMGVFLVTFPRDRIRTVVVWGIFVQVTMVRAFVLVGFWFLTHVISATGVLATSDAQQGGVAYTAHVGGFLFGAILGRLFEDPARIAEESV